MRRARPLALLAALAAAAPATAADGDGYLHGLSPGLATVTRDERLFAVALNAQGQAGGAEQHVADLVSGSNPLGGPVATPAATDRRRGVTLVAWVGRDPSMACEQRSFPSIPGMPPQQMTVCDREIFVRAVGRDGRPVAPAHRVSDTGDPSNPDAVAGHPALAWDKAAGRWLLVHSAQPDPQRPMEGHLVARALRPDGAPDGPPRTLVDEGAYPGGLVADRPGPGTTLLLMRGPSLNHRELHVTRLTAQGRRTGTIRQVSPAGGPGAGGPALAWSAARALTIWAEARSGAETGWMARRIDLRTGRPRGAAVALPYEQGTGQVTVAAAGDGWVYGFTRTGPRVNRQVASTQRATASGRPTGAVRVHSPEGANAHDVRVTATLVGWTDFPEGAAAVPRWSTRRRDG